MPSQKHKGVEVGDREAEALSLGLEDTVGVEVKDWVVQAVGD